MLMDYWSELRLNHHTESTSMLYAARECARIVLAEGLPACFERHALTSAALTAGLRAMGLELFGDQAHKMANVTGVVIPAGIDGEAVRASLLDDFGIEIGTSFGPLKGRIWRIGTMGYNCRKQNTLACLAALEAALRQQGFAAPAGHRGGPGSGSIPRGGAPGLGRARFTRLRVGAAAQPLKSALRERQPAAAWRARSVPR